MRLLLPREMAERLALELKRAGADEIGGVLMGEHIGVDTFRVAQLTVQRHGGSGTCFVRDPKDHQADLAAFFERTGNQYTRFNYLGEWHSHPSFPAHPSVTDVESMRGIIENPGVGADFLVLLVARLAASRTLEASVTVFVRDRAPFLADLILGEGTDP